ncbi:MAG TPA: hypothetical protein DG757_12475, partial [Bacillus sp. (in: Bacteria)]|nr:hypothetical protein [Bacillus sp. (in: firmicutes)]
MSKNDVLIDFFNKFEIYFEGEIISRELLLEAYSKFISNIMSKDEHAQGVILHTGSICFDIVTITYSILACIYHDETVPSDIISSLNPEDLIIYDRSRAVFKGFDEKGYAKIYQEVKNNGYLSSLNSTISPVNFHKIKPYMGNAKRLDGRGLRSSSSDRSKFINNIFAKPLKEISGITKKSFIILIDRKTADSLVRGLEFRYFDSNKSIKLTQLVTASYFTEGEEYRYAGNAGKSDSVLKFMSRSSIAREMILEDEDENVLGLLILSKELFDTGKSELISLVNRKSLKYPIVSYNIEQDDFKGLIHEFESSHLFACTEELLLGNYIEKLQQNHIMGDFNKRIHNTLYKKIHTRVIQTEIKWNIFDIKKAIRSIKENPQNEKTEQFVVYSYSLINLFSTAIFPLEMLENMINENRLSIQSPSEILEFLKNSISEAKGMVAEKMKYVCKELSNIYNSIYWDNLKYEKLIETFIYSNKNKSRAIIVPKAYYRDVFSELLFNRTKRSYDCTILTPAKFDNSTFFDEILVVGQPFGKKFDLFRSNSSLVYTVYLYEFEESNFKYQQQKFNKLVDSYNKRMGIMTNNDSFETDNFLSFKDQVEEERKIDLDISYFIEEISIKTSLRAVEEYKNLQNDVILSDISRIAKCTTGETLFLTKHYIPYVIDYDKEILEEGDVSKLLAGDTLIFTKNNNESQDLVEIILSHICEQDTENARILKREYEKSKYWKHVLKKYMEQNNLSFKDVSIQM